MRSYMKHSFTIVELLVVIAIISILSLCTIKFATDNKTKMQQEIVDILNKENIIEVYLGDVLLYEGNDFDFRGYEIIKIDKNKIYVERK